MSALVFYQLSTIDLGNFVSPLTLIAHSIFYNFINIYQNMHTLWIICLASPYFNSTMYS